MIRVTDTISIDESEVSESFVRASGPGGQNVNKLATAVQLRFDVRHSPSLPPDLRARLERLAGRRITRDGVLVIIAQRHRTQERNRDDARARLLRVDPPGRRETKTAPADEAYRRLARAPNRRQEAPCRREAVARRQTFV